MKIFKSLMFMALAIVLYSCEKENVDVVLDNSSPNGSALITKGGEEPASNPLQQTLQWTSYITMQILYKNSNTRDEFADALGTGNVVEMEDLIGSRVTNSDFKDAFMNQLTFYITFQLNPGWPKPEGDPPNPPITQGPPDPPCPPFQSCPPSVQDYVDFFIDELLIDNCFELYVPNALNFAAGDNLEMTSTAHPLDGTDANQGHRKGLTLFPGPTEEEDYWALWVTIQTVNDTYVANHKNVIVARPFRPVGPTSPNAPCTYSGYPADFTLFLD